MTYDRLGYCQDCCLVVPQPTGVADLQTSFQIRDLSMWLYRRHDPFLEAALLFFFWGHCSCWSPTPRADFGSGLANQGRSSAVNRKWGPNAVLRKVFSWGEALWRFVPHIVVEIRARLRGFKTEGLVQDFLWSLR